MPSNPRVAARTFYLNEQHELSRGEKPGGGRVPQYVDIDWASKGVRSVSHWRGLGLQFEDRRILFAIIIILFLRAPLRRCGSGRRIRRKLPTASFLM